MFVKRVTTMILVMLTMALLAGCRDPVKPEDPPAAASVLDLEGVEWVLVSLNGQALVPGSTITLTFSGDEVKGSAGCNGYGGGYTATDKGKLDIGMVAITEMYCTQPDGVMAQETAYVEALASAAAYRMAGDRIEIDNVAGDTVLVFSQEAAPDTPPGAPSDQGWQGQEWILTTFLADGTATSVVNGSEITITFEGGQLYGAAGCNSYSGPYTVDDFKLSVGVLAVTRMACARSDMMAQEQLYLDYLADTFAYIFEDGAFRLEMGDGRSLIFAVNES